MLYEFVEAWHQWFVTLAWRHDVLARSEFLWSQIQIRVRKLLNDSEAAKNILCRTNSIVAGNIDIDATNYQLFDSLIWCHFGIFRGRNATNRDRAMQERHFRHQRPADQCAQEDVWHQNMVRYISPWSTLLLYWAALSPLVPCILFVYKPSQNITHITS